MGKYFIKTYGCQMNIVDSERLARVLESVGYQPTEDSRLADIILVNTCVVRKHAEDRAAGYISSLKGLKNKNPQLKIGVCGCYVTAPGVKVSSLFPHVDVFIAPNQPGRLVDFLRSHPHLLSPSPLSRGKGKKGIGVKGVTKYITIMHGCDNFCSYCVVPYVRGREYSRPIDEILQEIRELGNQGIREVTLLGQNVNSYKYGLASLLKEIEGLKGLYEPEGRQDLKGRNGLKRVRFMTSHPRDMSDDIINAVAELPHVCEYFHLPIQHGDDQILKSMNRGYTSNDYRRLIDKIRAKMPGAAITSDVIVGYPGETDEQFRHTLYIIEQIGFDACNTAAYSVRPGTAAAKLPDDVPDKVKQERLQEVMRVVERVAGKNNQKLVGNVQEVLVDSVDDRHYVGRTRGNKIVKFAAAKTDLRGQLVNVRIASAKSWVLEAHLCPDESGLWRAGRSW